MLSACRPKSLERIVVERHRPGTTRRTSICLASERLYQNNLPEHRSRRPPSRPEDRRVSKGAAEEERRRKARPFQIDDDDDDDVSMNHLGSRLGSAGPHATDEASKR